MTELTCPWLRILASSLAGAAITPVVLFLIRLNVPRLPLSLTSGVIASGVISAAVAGAMIESGTILLASLGLSALLIALSAIDLMIMRLPDSLNLILGASGLGMSVLSAEPVPHLIGAVVGFGMLWLINKAFEVWRGRQGLGMGDAKLLAGAGAWLGWSPLPSVLIIAAGLAILIQLARITLRLARGQNSGGRASDGLNEAFAFGPYLATGLWFTWVFGPLTLTGS